MTDDFDIGQIPATKDLKEASGTALSIFGAVFGGIPLIMAVKYAFSEPRRGRGYDTR